MVHILRYSIESEISTVAANGIDPARHFRHRRADARCVGRAPQ